MSSAFFSTRTNGSVGYSSARTASKALADMAAAGIEPSGFSTGFSPLDQVLQGGFGLGALVVLGGKPGQGKTVAALQWARHVAAGGDTAVFACYEHDEVTLLTRLLAGELAEAAEGRGCGDHLRLERLRAGLRAVEAGTVPLREVLDSDDLLLEAEARLAAYAERLVLVRASGASTDVATLTRFVEEYRGERVVLFVDYIQKVPVRPEPAEEAERVKRVAEALKDLALCRRVAVVAVAAADRAGLASRRLRLHHVRGSGALAYEADVAVMLNDKLSVVSKAHLFDATRVEQFRGSVVFSVEKNRGGQADVDLEFGKDFANYRFHPAGRWSTERLWEEGGAEE